MYTYQVILWKFGFVDLFKKNDFFLNEQLNKNINIFYSNYVSSEKKVKKKEYLNLAKYQFYLNYKGYRHYNGLPVNGQRTVSNAKTCRSFFFHNKIVSIVQLINKKILIDK